MTQQRCCVGVLEELFGNSWLGEIRSDRRLERVSMSDFVLVGVSHISSEPREASASRGSEKSEQTKNKNYKSKDIR